MQSFQSVFKVEDSEKKDSTVKILADVYCRKILDSVIYKPKSAIEISYECKIPISTVYRRIQILHDNKLLLTSGAISEDGKKLFLYKSKIRGINCDYKLGQLDVELILNN